MRVRAARSQIGAESVGRRGGYQSLLHTQLTHSVDRQWRAKMCQKTTQGGRKVTGCKNTWRNTILIISQLTHNHNTGPKTASILKHHWHPYPSLWGWLISKRAGSKGKSSDCVIAEESSAFANQFLIVDDLPPGRLLSRPPQCRQLILDPSWPKILALPPFLPTKHVGP